MLTDNGFEGTVKKMVREYNWDKLAKDKDKMIKKINDLPNFLLSIYVYGVVNVLLEDEDKYKKVVTILPYVFKGVSDDKRKHILTALVEEERLHKSYNMTDRVITSFGWGINGIRKELVNVGDSGLMLEFVNVLNTVGETLEKEGYFRAVLDFQTVSVSKREFTTEDMLRGNIKVDIVKDKAIVKSYK